MQHTMQCIASCVHHATHHATRAVHPRCLRRHAPRAHRAGGRHGHDHDGGRRELRGARRREVPTLTLTLTLTLIRTPTLTLALTLTLTLTLALNLTLALALTLTLTLTRCIRELLAAAPADKTAPPLTDESTEDAGSEDATEDALAAVENSIASGVSVEGGTAMLQMLSCALEGKQVACFDFPSPHPTPNPSPHPTQNPTP